VTIADLEQLLREYIPDSGVCVQERGRAGVTMLIDDPHRNGRYDNLESMPALRSTAPPALRSAAPPAQAFWRDYYHKASCLVCKKEFDRNGSRRKYCSDACQQKAYRERKKKQRA